MKLREGVNAKIRERDVYKCRENWKWKFTASFALLYVENNNIPMYDSLDV